MLIKYLCKAYDSGITIYGISAGAMCFFEEGTALYFENGDLKEIIKSGNNAKDYFIDNNHNSELIENSKNYSNE